FVVRRRAYRPEEFSTGAPAIRWPAFASWIPGIALYFAIVYGLLPGFPPVGATLPSFGLAAGLHIALATLAEARASKGSDAPRARNG
ncbi:MAG TPA: hypothetical protein VK723_01145, partial [Thermoplasmata archaeon]|nr:hypothetical protein [Thermoplasmata archaeon]